MKSKQRISITIHIVMITVIIIGWISSSAATDETTYYRYLNTAYEYYTAAEYEQAYDYYLAATKAVTRYEQKYFDAFLGAQNCLVKLAYYDAAIRLGKQLVAHNGDDKTLLFNNAFSYYSLADYYKAIIYYNRLYHISGKSDVLALKGLIWSWHYAGRDDRAQELIRELRAMNEYDREIEDLYTRITTNYNLVFTSYGTYINYSSDLKDWGSYYDGILSLIYRDRYSFDAVYTESSIDFLDPDLDTIREKHYLFNYGYRGIFGFNLAYRNLHTKDVTLGNGNIYFTSLEVKNIRVQISMSDYKKSDAYQVGLGYRYSLGQVAFISQYDFINRDEIPYLDKKIVF